LGGIGLGGLGPGGGTGGRTHVAVTDWVAQVVAKPVATINDRTISARTKRFMASPFGFKFKYEAQEPKKESNALDSQN
jgi:hypothetical protein